MNNPFLKEIRSWNWKHIVSSAKREPQENDEGEMEGRWYIGSVLSLTPSGKYYTPFACGNVDDCHNCGGSGMLRQSAKDRRREKKWEAKRKWLVHRFDVARRGNPFGETRLLEKSTATMRNVQRFRPESCQRCGGIGSAEAHDDELWHEALEKVASENGGWIVNGEGDTCDLIFVIPVENYFREGMKLIVSAHSSNPGEGLTYPAGVYVACEEGNSGGWDVYDVTTLEGVELSIYGFSVEKIEEA